MKRAPLGLWFSRPYLVHSAPPSREATGRLEAQAHPAVASEQESGAADASGGREAHSRAVPAT